MGIFTGHITVKQKREKGKRRKLPPPILTFIHTKNINKKLLQPKQQLSVTIPIGEKKQARTLCRVSVPGQRVFLFVYCKVLFRASISSS